MRAYAWGVFFLICALGFPAHALRPGLVLRGASGRARVLVAEIGEAKRSQSTWALKFARALRDVGLEVILVNKPANARELQKVAEYEDVEALLVQTHRPRDPELLALRDLLVNPSANRSDNVFLMALTKSAPKEPSPHGITTFGTQTDMTHVIHHLLEHLPRATPPAGESQ